MSKTEIKLKKKQLAGNEHTESEFFPCQCCLEEKNFYGCAIPCNRKQLIVSGVIKK